MFKLETFVEDCLAAVKEDPTHKATSEVIKRAFADPGAILNQLGEPTGPGIQPIYNSPELTILNLVWKPSITIMPHNHEMWAVIGIYGGREDNIFWRRIADDPDGHIEAAGVPAARAFQRDEEILKRCFSGHLRYRAGKNDLLSGFAAQAGAVERVGP